MNHCKKEKAPQHRLPNITVVHLGLLLLSVKYICTWSRNREREIKFGNEWDGKKWRNKLPTKGVDWAVVESHLIVGESAKTLVTFEEALAVYSSWRGSSVHNAHDAVRQFFAEVACDSKELLEFICHVMGKKVHHLLSAILIHFLKVSLVMVRANRIASEGVQKDHFDVALSHNVEVHFYLCATWLCFRISFLSCHVYSIDS